MSKAEAGRRDRKLEGEASSHLHRAASHHHLIPTIDLAPPLYPHISSSRITMGLSYKAGRAFRRGETDFVDAEPEKGLLEVKDGGDGRQFQSPQLYSLSPPLFPKLTRPSPCLTYRSCSSAAHLLASPFVVERVAGPDCVPRGCVVLARRRVKRGQRVRPQLRELAGQALRESRYMCRCRAMGGKRAWS